MGMGWLLMPALLLLFIFFVLPLGTVLVYSFGRTVPGTVYVPDFTFDNYTVQITTPVYLAVLARTLKLSLITTGLALLIGYPYAYLMARGHRTLRSALLVAVLLPLMVSVVVRTYGWIVVLGLDGPLAEQTADPNIYTPIGKFLRRTSLDELPQLLCVMRGDMSLIGPRPERVQYVERFAPTIYRYHERHRIRPGMTGWAQVNGLRGQTSLADRVEWDMFYLENWSPALDMRILGRTAQAAWRGTPGV